MTVTVDNGTTVVVRQDRTEVITALGAPGSGVPAGGTAGQMLIKINSADYNTTWTDAPTVANPTGTIGLAVVNGVLGSVMRSDAAPALSQAIAPTWTGRHIWSKAGLASTPPVSYTGTWFSGGDATTTKPLVLIEPAGTTSTGWNTAGTGFGANAPAGFGGYLADFQVAGASVSRILSTGTLQITDNSLAPWIDQSNGFVATLLQLRAFAGTWFTLTNDPFDVLSFNLHANSGGFAFTRPIKIAGANTDAARNLLDLTGAASRTAAHIRLRDLSSTSTVRSVVELDAAWADSTDATRKARGILRAYDATAAREAIRFEADGAAARLGFFGGTAAAKPTVTGAKGGNAALTSLMTALAALGLVTDSTT